MTSEAGGAKLCCKCGKDLAGAQRMKDSDGRYWCPNCHEEDRLVRKYGFAEAGATGAKAQNNPAKAKTIKLLILIAALAAVAVLLNVFVF